MKSQNDEKLLCCRLLGWLSILREMCISYSVSGWRRLRDIVTSRRVMNSGDKQQYSQLSTEACVTTSPAPEIRHFHHPPSSSSNIGASSSAILP